jgi:hypothetical protein
LLQIAGRRVACHYAEPLEAVKEEDVLAALSDAKNPSLPDPQRN